MKKVDDSIKDYVSYNPQTGKIHWIKDKGRAKSGDLAGTQEDTGALKLVFNRRLYKLHRLAWFLYYGVWPKEEIDHINHDKLDNRIINLRETDRKTNGRNLPLFTNSLSGVCGVHWFERTQKWTVSIKVDGRNIRLGYFSNFDEAVKVRKDAEIKYGFHENHGKPKETRE